MIARPPTDDLTPAFVDALREFGFEHGVAVRIADALEDSLDTIVDRRAASMLVQVFQQLDGTPAALALRRVLVGSDEPRRAEARRIGCSPKAIRKSEAQIRQRLGMPVPARATIQIKKS